MFRGRALFEKVPWLLVALRGVAALAIVVAERTGASGVALATIVAIAFVSDVFDGVIARRLGVATSGLRRADTLMDALFYIAATVALFQRAPNVLAQNVVWLAVLVGLEIARAAVESVKFGRIASYHMWSAKLWGIALFCGFCEAFLTGAPGPFFRAALIVGIGSDIEGLAASLVLKRWRHDVPSLAHALRLRD